MSNYKQYKIFCIDENVDKVVIANLAPTVCPTNASHTVRPKSVAVITDMPNGSIIEALETAEPATPGLNKNILYFDAADGLLSTKDDTGFVRKYYGSKTNVIYVSPLGESDFTTIKDAVTAANAKLPSIVSTIRIQPGTYSEDNPITIGAGISLVGEGGPLNTVVVAQNPNSRLFVPSASSSIRGLACSGVTGNAAIFYTGNLGQMSINETLFLNCDVGVQSDVGPGICFVSKAAVMSRTVGNLATTVNTGFLASSGGVLLLTEIGCLGSPINKIGCGYKSTGKNASTPSKIMTQGGAMRYCTIGGQADNGGITETYMMKIENVDNAMMVGNLGTDSTLIFNNTNISASTTYDLNVLATNATVRAATSTMDVTKINNPNGVRLFTNTIDLTGCQDVYNNMNIYGNLSVSGNLNITNGVTGAFRDLSIDVNGTTTNTSYETIGRAIFPGTTKFGTPSEIKFISKQDVSGTIDHNVQVIDGSNGNLIVGTSDTLTNTVEAINSIGTLGNLSASEALWFIQAKVSGSGGMNLYNVQVTH